MNPIKLSAIASLVAVSVAAQQLADAINVSEDLLLLHNNNITSVKGGIDRTIFVNGFPNTPEEHDEFEFKIFHGHARAWGYLEIKLFVLAYDLDQARRLENIFNIAYDKHLRTKNPKHSNVASYIFEEDISTDQVIEEAKTSQTTYTLFNEQLFT